MTRSATGHGDWARRDCQTGQTCSNGGIISWNKTQTPPRAWFARLLATTLLAATFAFSAPASGSELADRVIVLANSDAPDSVAVAEHYARVRLVPSANVIALRMPLAETISWKEFIATIWQPLEDELVKRGWIDAIRMDLFDELGRRKYAVSGHKIAALVVCRGVPLRIANDPSLYRDARPLTDHAEFRTNQGAVDSELSLLARPDYPINACVPNPLFHEANPSDEMRSSVVEVARLDGPSAADAMALVDSAVLAERDGLLGRAYVDMAGPSEKGNQWIEETAKEMAVLGFNVSVGRGPSTVAATARFDAPVLYFGWYAPDINGPFLLPGFRFPPGAIAVHIHSFSAHTLRSTTEGWSGPLVARGVTATVGNVYEPYLEFLHRPELLFEALARGENLVDAAYYALPCLSWQSIVIGDPLYRPFAVPLAAQVKNLAALPPPLAGYAVIRRMNLLDAGGPEGRGSGGRKGRDEGGPEPRPGAGAGAAARRRRPHLPVGLDAQGCGGFRRHRPGRLGAHPGGRPVPRRPRPVRRGDRHVPQAVRERAAAGG